MATYKVIQDIEAEDKLVGPLSLRQFIYAGIVLFLGWIAFLLAKANILLAIPFLPPMLFFALLAFPFGQDQSTEVWLLAKIRFALKPQRRLWNQDGISQLVTVTAPKRVEQILTDGLSQNEVKSRLSALANTLDSRGWAVKNVNVNLYGQAGYLNDDGGSDRLVSTASLPQDVPTTDVTAMDDMLDEATSATAQNLERMITQSEQTHRKELVEKMAGKTPAAPAAGAQADYWFMNQPPAAPSQPGLATFDHNPLVAPGAQQAATTAAPTTAAEEALLDKLHTEHGHQPASFSHLKTIQPIGSKPAAPAKQTPAPKQPNPGIMRLARNDDLNIDTIARQAKRDLDSGEEVVISLH